MDNRKHRCEMKLNLVLAFPLCRPCWGTAFSSTTGTCFWTPPRGTVGLGLCLADPHQPTFTIFLAQKIDISKCEKWPPWRGFGSQFIRESSRCSLNVWKIQLIHQRTRKGYMKFLIYYSYNYIHIHMHIYIYILRYKDWNGIPFSIRLNHSQSAGGNGELHGLVLYIALISIAHNATENHCSLCLSPINFCSHVFPILAAENFTKSKAFWSLTRLHCPEHRNYDPEMSKLFVKYFEDTPKNVRS